MSDVGDHVIFIKRFQALDIIKINKDMGSFFGGNFNTRYVQKAFVSVQLNRPSNIIVIGDGDTDV